MARICLNVLVGIPASGKTTYCQQIVSLPNRNFKVVHLCYDSYIKIEDRFDIFCNEVGLYRTRRQTLLSSVEAIIVSIQENDTDRLNELLNKWNKDFENAFEVSSPPAVSQDYLLLIDDNNYYRSMRWDWARIARKLSLSFFETFFDNSLHLALERNETRDLPVSKDVITRMWTRLEKPCGKLFRWEHNFISIHGELDLASLLVTIHQCFEAPEKATNASSTSIPMQQSTVHKVDILSRKAISKKLTSAKDSMTKHELKSYVGMLQERKKVILDQFRAGEQNVPDEFLETLVEDLF